MIGCEQVCQALNDNAQEITELRQQLATVNKRLIEAEQELAELKRPVKWHDVDKYYRDDDSLFADGERV